MSGAPLALRAAGPDDAATVSALLRAAAEELTRRFGRGRWSFAASERAVRSALATPASYLAWRDGDAVATLRLSPRRPWAIVVSRFSAAARPLYLTDMAVRPDAQRTGVGRRALELAAEEARRWPADALRLDAYDAPAGAGEFYRRCGWRDVGSAAYRGQPLLYFELRL